MLSEFHNLSVVYVKGPSFDMILHVRTLNHARDPSSLACVVRVLGVAPLVRLCYMVLEVRPFKGEPHGPSFTPPHPYLTFKPSRGPSFVKGTPLSDLVNPCSLVRVCNEGMSEFYCILYV